MQQPCWRASSLLVLLALASCGASAHEATAPEATPPKIEALQTPRITPSRFIPEVDADQHEPFFEDVGRARFILGGMRLVVHDSGLTERSVERFPGFASRSVSARQLPERLGGGYVFFNSGGDETGLWWAPDWLGKLVPLGTFPRTKEVIAGFDRLYLRLHRGGLLAFDLEERKIVPLGAFPLASRFGAMAFADAWRAVVDTELRGPMATFDAGASWWPLPIAETIVAVVVVDGDPVVYPAGAGGAAYRLAEDGQLHRERPASPADEASAEASDEPPREPHPLGARPLRTAIEEGWPQPPSAAVVLHQGTLVRVSLRDGSVLKERRGMLRDGAARCTPTRLGNGFGFICGSEQRPTTVQRFTAPFGLHEIARFAQPRFVSSSGNGLLVVRGGCSDELVSLPEQRTYCILDGKGRRREIAVKGELGSERVVALADGRIVVLVVPRLGDSGRLTVIDGQRQSTVKLRFPAASQGLVVAEAVAVARKGLWLEGFQQRSATSVAGWVEAGGPALGVTVSLSGKVGVGELRDAGGQLLTSGPLAVVVTHDERAAQSVDGGMSWQRFELPELAASPGGPPSRGCSPVGCAFSSWLRLGWGKPGQEDDLSFAERPARQAIGSQLRPSMALRCRSVAREKAVAIDSEPRKRTPYGGWDGIRSTPPPRLLDDELGVGKGSGERRGAFVQAYAWGKKGADWTRSGWWQIRFDDRLQAAGGLRRSLPTRPPWSDAAVAAQAMGARGRGSYWRLEAVLDPGGKAALASLCLGSYCSPYGVSEGRAIVAFTPRGGKKRFRRPLAHGAVRIGERWYVLTQDRGGGGLTLWLAEQRSIRPITTFHHIYGSKPIRSGAGTAFRLVRRAAGDQLGLLVSVPPDLTEGHRAGRLIVLPIEPVGARLGEPLRLGPSDLGGVLPRLCRADDDGWLVTQAMPSTILDLVGGRGYARDDIEMRLRLDTGDRCVESIAARGGFSAHGDKSRSKPRGKHARAKPSAGGIPLMLRMGRSANSGRWQFSCE